MSGKNPLDQPGAWESRAFFAALLAASQGHDGEAAQILREIATRMTKEFVNGGGTGKGGGRG